MSKVIIHKVRMKPMPGNPFPGSRVLGDVIAEAERNPAPAVPSPYSFFGLTDQHLWVRCECPWWHRLPFVGRRVHEYLP